MWASSSEEFGHAAFGLPDIYTTDAAGLAVQLGDLRGGPWNGPLGRASGLPPFPLVFRYMVGWANPLRSTTPLAQPSRL